MHFTASYQRIHSPLWKGGGGQRERRRCLQEKSVTTSLRERTFFFSSSKSSWEFSLKTIHFETATSFLLTGADGFVVLVVLVRFVSTG